MAKINCKMCGCPNEVEPGKFIVICEGCGNEQVVPNLDSEKKTNLFNRANAARLKCDFEKALSNYEQILIDYPSDAEAHWGIVLCRYGIEYVDDVKTKKKIPTCHRTIYQSIFDDVDYKEAIANCDVVAKRIYQAEAENIDKIQKSIIAISQKEKPYDIFICYKETDANGNRTRDSFVAEDIYNELTYKDYKVFFSRVTLESKLGEQYEPIIFAALQSAKIMLVIGSKKEYFESVWVKNEWSRFLSFMEDNKASKYMIPCYRDMEAYDMPDEFLSLQSQNLDKLGAKQDLLRAIDKIFGKDRIRTLNDIENSIENDANMKLLKRALFSIEDEDYSKANEILEKVLDNNPECAEAYAYKILIDKKLHKLEDLGTLSDPLDNDKNYQKAIRFASPEFLSKIEGYNKIIISNLTGKYKKQIYNNAISEKNKGHYEEASSLFSKIIDYEDSKKQVDECEELIKNVLYTQALDYKNMGDFENAINIFSKIIYYRDSQEQIESCKELKENSKKDKIYFKYTVQATNASSKTTFNEKDFKQAIYELKNIIGYKDTEQFIKTRESIFEKMKSELEQEAEERKVREEQIKAEKEKQAKIKKDKMILFAKILTPIVIVLVALLVLPFSLFIPMGKYNNAIDLINQEKYSEAKSILKDINYSDSKKLVNMIDAKLYFEKGMYEEGIDAIYKIGGSINVSYDADGGNASKNNEIIRKKAYINNPTTKDGYTFYGWKMDVYEIDIMSYKASITLIANYSPITYSINYDLKGGSFNIDAPSEYITTDNVVIPNPQMTGYEFVGWIEDENDVPQKDYSFNDKYGDKNFIAVWTIATYIISYDVNGGDALDSDVQYVKYKENYKLKTPTRKGYNFAGWYINDNAYISMSGVYKKTENISLKARWTLSKYTIRYVLNEGINDDSNPTSYNFDTDDILIKNPTRLGYTFIGWTTQSNDTPIIDYVIPKNSTGNIILTANWETSKYTITYDVDGGDDLENKTQEVTYNSTYKLVIPTRTGYKFAGWYDNKNNLVEDGIWSTTSDVTLKARWTMDTYYIAYYLNGGINNSSNPVEYNYETATILANPTRTGYTFIGWTTPLNNTPVISCSIPRHSTGDKSFTANWKANQYKIKYNVNGGEALENNTQQVTYGSSYYLAIPTRIGYTFAGWYDSKNNLYKAGIWKTASNVTLIARWTIKTFYITYSLNGGTNNSSNPTKYDYDTNTIILEEPTKTGYTFIGWTTSSNDIPNTYCTIPRHSTGDKSFTANWKVNEYTIKYDVNGGDELENDTQQVTYDSSFTLIVPTRVGYQFAGWFYNDKLVNTKVWSIPNNCILSAKWVADTDTKYIVNHYKENANDDGYTLDESLLLTGVSDSYVTPSFKTYIGFDNPEPQTVNISPDGSLVINYYYTRKLFTITFVSNGGSDVNTIEQKYLQHVQQ